MSTTLAADRSADEYLHPHVNSSHAMLMQIVHEWHHLNKYVNIHTICKYCYCNSVLHTYPFNLIYGQTLFPPALSYCIFLSFLTLNHRIQYAMSYRIQTYRISWDELPRREEATEPEPLAYINSTLCFALQMCFAPQRRAIFGHLTFQNWSESVVFCTFGLTNVLGATAVCHFLTSELAKSVPP